MAENVLVLKRTPGSQLW